VRRIGIFMPYANGDAEIEDRVRALRDELARPGWTEGVNVQFDERWTTDNMDWVRTNAASLLASNPDAVVTVGGRVVPVLVQLSHSVPIVLPGQIDPVGRPSPTRHRKNAPGVAPIECLRPRQRKKRLSDGRMRLCPCVS
jgi:ABC-type uncharacterized transport system substrate-binding protein